MYKRLVTGIVTALLLTSMITTTFSDYPSQIQSQARVYLQPSNYVFCPGNGTIGTFFNVTVCVTDIWDLGSFQVRMYFDDSIINITRWFEPKWDPQYVFFGRSTIAVPTPPSVEYSHNGPNNGSVQVAATLFSPVPPGFNGSGKLCLFEFVITAVPELGDTLSCALGIDNAQTYLLDLNGAEMPAIKENGRYELSSQPAPAFITPMENSNIYGDIRLTATELVDPTIMASATFEYSNGTSWVIIGVDTNGTMEIESFDHVGYGIGVWNVSWAIGSLSEGNYSLRVRMKDIYDREGLDTVQVFVDPTGPVPIVVQPVDFAALNGTAAIEAITMDENVVIMMAEYLSITTLSHLFVKGVPLKDQHNYGPLGGATPGTKDWDNNDYCAPTAAASSLKYFALHCYENLMKDPITGLPISQKDLVEGLAKLAETKENEKCHPDGENDGTNVDKLIKAIQDWIDGHGGCLKVEEVDPTFANYKKELESCEDVLVSTGYHRMTGNSVWNKMNPDGTYTVDFMDPWTGTIRWTKMKPNGEFEWPPGSGKWVSGRMIKISPCPKPPKPSRPAVPPRAPSLSQWGEIGIDINGTDGWIIHWNTSALPQNEHYLIRVSMMDANGRSGWTMLSVFVSSPYDIKVLDMASSKNVVGAGRSVAVNVTVENQGSYAETFNVTAYYGNGTVYYGNWTLTPEHWDEFWSMGDVNRDGYINQTDLERIAAMFGWIGAPGSIPEDINSDGKVDVSDLSICGVHQGLNIWKYYLGGGIIGTQTVSNMPPEDYMNLTYIWDTTGVAYGNYTISAYAWPVSGETDVADNGLDNIYVFVTLPGDINGDQYVNAKDAVILGGAFGSTRGDPTYSPNADINSDDWCNAKDAIILGTHFDQHW